MDSEKIAQMALPGRVEDHEARLKAIEDLIFPKDEEMQIEKNVLGRDATEDLDLGAEIDLGNKENGEPEVVGTPTADVILTPEVKKEELPAESAEAPSPLGHDFLKEAPSGESTPETAAV